MMGVFSDIGARKMGHKRLGNDLIGARYMMEMSMWVLTKFLSRIHLSLLKSGDPLDAQCEEKVHLAVTQLGEAWRAVQWVTNAVAVGDGKGIRLETAGIVHRTNLEMNVEGGK